MSEASVSPTSNVETIPCKVNWKDRKATDVGCGVLFLVSLLAWFGIGFLFIGGSMEIFETDENGMIVGYSEEVKTSSSECCTAIQNEPAPSGVIVDPNGGICWQNFDRRRYLAENDNFPKDGGIFDVFALKPGVPTVMIMACILMSIAWIMLLRSFAKSVVFGCEFVKIAALGYLGVKSDMNPIFFAMAIGYAVYAFCFRKQLSFAAKIIAHAANGLKENPAMFFALLAVKLVYIVQALLYIKFFEASVKVKSVEMVTSPIVDFSGPLVCSTGSQYTCDYTMDYDPNHCDANGGYCGYPESGKQLTCELVEPSWVGSGRYFLMTMWLWSVMFYTQFRLVIVSYVLGSWHWHPENKPTPLQALVVSGTKSFGTISYSGIICAIVEKFYEQTKMKWYHWIPPFLFYAGPYKIFCCILGWCLKTCIKMLTKFSLIIHVFTGDNFFGSAKKCFGIMQRHFVGGFITESSSKAIMQIFAWLMSVALLMSTWAWIDELYDWETVPGKGSAIWILWSFLAAFCTYYPVLGLFVLTLLDGLMKNAGDPSYWVSPFAAIFVGCIARLFFTYMGGIILDAIDVCFVCWAIDKDNNVDLSKSEFSSIVVDVPGVIQAANPMHDSKDPLLVQQPVQAGQFVPATNATPQGQVQAFAAPQVNGAVQMMSMGQPMMMTPEQMAQQQQMMAQQMAMMQQQQQQMGMMQQQQQPQQATM